MKTAPLNLRKQILDAYDSGEGTQVEVARQFKVSLGLVKKLINQRRHTGDIAPRQHFHGRKPKILEQHRQHMRHLLARQANLTLAELRTATGLSCSLPAIHNTLSKMNLTYNKRIAPVGLSTGI